MGVCTSVGRAAKLTTRAGTATAAESRSNVSLAMTLEDGAGRGYVERSGSSVGAREKNQRQRTEGARWSYFDGLLRANGLRYPLKRQLELASRIWVPPHLASGSQVGAKVWGQALAVARWAPTCAGAQSCQSTASTQASPLDETILRTHITAVTSRRAR